MGNPGTVILVLQVPMYSVCSLMFFVFRTCQANSLACFSVGNKMSHIALLLLAKTIRLMFKVFKASSSFSLLTPINFSLVFTSVVSRATMWVFTVSKELIAFEWFLKFPSLQYIVHLFSLAYFPPRQFRWWHCWCYINVSHDGPKTTTAKQITGCLFSFLNYFAIHLKERQNKFVDRQTKTKMWKNKEKKKK